LSNCTLQAKFLATPLGSAMIKLRWYYPSPIIRFDSEYRIFLRPSSLIIYVTWTKINKMATILDDVEVYTTDLPFGECKVVYKGRFGYKYCINIYYTGLNLQIICIHFSKTNYWFHFSLVYSIFIQSWHKLIRNYCLN